MIINGNALLKAAPIKNMLDRKVQHNGVSHGLAEAGYDIRIKQDVEFKPGVYHFTGELRRRPRILMDDELHTEGNFCLASAMEEFIMPDNLVGLVKDKSTWARKGLSVFNTVIEPGFRGGLTLELVFHGNEPLHIPAGSGIAQVLFESIKLPAQYNGKYQDQSSDPVESIMVP